MTDVPFVKEAIHRLGLPMLNFGQTRLNNYFHAGLPPTEIIRISALGYISSIFACALIRDGRLKEGGAYHFLLKFWEDRKDN